MGVFWEKSGSEEVLSGYMMVSFRVLSGRHAGPSTGMWTNCAEMGKFVGSESRKRVYTGRGWWVGSYSSRPTWVEKGEVIAVRGAKQ